MKIAQVAPLHESVPPLLYGGTERVVSYLTDELVRQGHEVTLYASGDSQTSARLRPASERALRMNAAARNDPLARHLLLCEMAVQEAESFDVLHFHLDHLPFPLIRHAEMTALTTVHSRLDVPDLIPLYREFADMHLVSVSEAQRRPMPWASWIATVHHGLPEDLHQPCYRPEEYLAFLGRISPEKRVEWAVEIALRARMQLRVAAKVDVVDKEYFERSGACLRLPHVEFLGEIGEQEKTAFLGHARGLLLPLDWPEPFGIVMIEALACGTPVIAFRRGSVEEIVDDGVTGFIVDSIEEAVEAVHRLGTIDRRACRHAFESRFTARHMCERYVQAYEEVIAKRSLGAGTEDGLPMAS